MGGLVVLADNNRASAGGRPRSEWHSSLAGGHRQRLESLLRVVIAGGGIVGTACAWTFVLVENERDVEVVGAGSSGRCPGADDLTLLYDEGCGFCTRLAGWLAGLSEITAAPIGSTAGSLMLRDLSSAERYASVHVVDVLGRRRSAGAALPPLLRRLPGGRPVAAASEALPRLTDHAYRLVARNRGLLSRIGELAVCVAPRCVWRLAGATAPQSTESRSTTNTSGSCGLITPPAPRAP